MSSEPGAHKRPLKTLLSCACATMFALRDGTLTAPSKKKGT
jgi:hypothetical protein